jgi:hypothetical protein
MTTKKAEVALVKGGRPAALSASRLKSGPMILQPFGMRVSQALLDDLEVLAYVRGYTSSGFARWLLEREVLAAADEIAAARAKLGIAAPAQAGLDLAK